MGLFKRRYPVKKRNCSHPKDKIRNIYGDEIIVANARSECLNCGQLFGYLNGRN
jgi:hypothetical protein